MTKEVPDMTARRRNRQPLRDEPHYRVRGVRRDPPDIAKLSRALLGLAIAEAEKQAEAEHRATTQQLAPEHGVSTADRPPGSATDTTAERQDESHE
jgi:hypothetical protein